MRFSGLLHGQLSLSPDSENGARELREAPANFAHHHVSHGERHVRVNRVDGAGAGDVVERALELAERDRLIFPFVMTGSGSEIARELYLW